MQLLSHQYVKARLTSTSAIREQKGLTNSLWIHEIKQIYHQTVQRLKHFKIAFDICQKYIRSIDLTSVLGLTPPCQLVHELISLGLFDSAAFIV